MRVDYLTGFIDDTFKYFQALGDWHKDPAGVQAVRQVRDRMVHDLEAFNTEPTKADVKELCREWRAMRIQPTGEASYPPDMFIESVVQILEIS